MAQRNTAPDDAERPRPLDPAMEAAVDWFARLQAEDVTEAERAVFEAWKAADPAHAEAYRKLQALWGAPEFATAADRAGRAGPPATERGVPAKPRRRS